EFRLATDSAALGAGKRAEPRMLPNNTGFEWPLDAGNLAPGAGSIKLSFEDPLPANAVYPEPGDASGGRIRVMFFRDKIIKGLHTFVMTLTLPPGAKHVLGSWERYAPVDLTRWNKDALLLDSSPVDLSFLNESDKPAGKRGPIRVEGDRLVYPDGSEARFWGCNVAANALFTDRDRIARHAKRLAAL